MPHQQQHSWRFLSYRRPHPPETSHVSSGAGRCESVSCAFRPGLSCEPQGAAHRPVGWHPAWLPQPGGSCHPDIPSTTRSSRPTHTTLLTYCSIGRPHSQIYKHQSLTTHTYEGPKEKSTDEVWKRKSLPAKPPQPHNSSRLCYLFLSAINQAVSHCPDTIQFLQMSAALLELIWLKGETWGQIHCIVQIRKSLYSVSKETKLSLLLSSRTDEMSRKKCTSNMKCISLIIRIILHQLSGPRWTYFVPMLRHCSVEWRKCI